MNDPRVILIEFAVWSSMAAVVVWCFGIWFPYCWRQMKQYEKDNERDRRELLRLEKRSQ